MRHPRSFTRSRAVGRALGVALALGLAGVLPGRPLLAQQPTQVVTGHVTDATSGKPLIGAEVFVPGPGGASSATYGAVTDAEGNFTLRVPSTATRLSVRLIGYKAKELAISSRMDVALATDVLNLDEIVVTGQATGVSKRNLANAVSVVNAAELNQVPAASVENQLYGKVAGANIQSNSGAPGGGNSVQLRGVSTIIGNSRPLYVVDGVLVSDDAIQSGANSITQAGSGISNTQDNAPNRIADLNPADIERIEVLKGASAAAIYGSRANNGVIIITTKRGTPGKARYQLAQRVGFSELSKEWGSRSFTLPSAVATYCGSNPSASCQANIGQYFDADGSPKQVFDHEKELAGGHPLSHQTELSVSGGSDKTTYYASGLVQHDGGVVKGTYYDKQSLRVNLDQVASPTLNFHLASSFTHSKDGRGFTNNDNTSTSYYVALMGTPNFVDLRPDAQGIYPANPFQTSNPLQTAALARNDEDVYRFLGSLSGTWDVFKRERQSLQLSARGGADVFNQDNLVYSPQELQYEPINNPNFPGTSVIGSALSRQYNADLNAVHAFTPASNLFTATTSAGIQYKFTDLDVTRVLTQGLFPGQQNAGSGTRYLPEEIRARSKDFGAFVQEELVLRDRLTLTGSVRADRSSSNADPDQWFYYPKANASYRWGVNRGPIGELKFRGAFGQSGNAPLYGQKFNSLNPGNLVGMQTLALGTVAVAPDLHPERQTEFEGGLDAYLFRDRASLDVTYFDRRVNELLLQRALPPSTGFATALYNSHGQLTSKGVEAALHAAVVQTRGFEWSTHATFTKWSSVIDSLDVPPFNSPNGGFGTSLGAGRIEQGKSATQIVGRDTIAFEDDPRCLEALGVEAGSGKCKPGTRIVTKLGDATPDFRMGFANEFRYRAFRLSSTIDWQHGGDAINLTGFLYDANQNTKDFDEPCKLDGCRAGETMGQYRLRVYPGKTNRPWIEDASFVKLREVSLTYDVPATLLRSAGLGGASSLQITLSGRNLATFTGYKGFDPEVNNFGSQAIRTNVDVAPYPPSRTFWLSVNVGF
ncbi:MAG TPA: SusC/RagA family TonB-linked outer membrane protein [Longimicrobiales bacterium]|nr:SusC/RagA family TonB-linked outer membrane protein [Longimicrobiales bacterium]